MPRYDRTLARRVARALELVDGDLREAFAKATDLKMTPEALERFILTDMENDGPIFGRLTRNLMGGLEQGVMAAHGQGVVVGEAVGAGFIDLHGMTDEQIERVFAGNDPETMAAMEDAVADRAFYTWVAVLVNSCPYCVALHGTEMTKDEWRASGHDPETIHAENSINAKCYCRFVLADVARKDPLSTAAPLRRESLATAQGIKGNRRTQRSIAQRDPEKSLIAAKKATETKSGRQMLKAMGDSAPPVVAKAVRDARADARADREE